MAKRKIGDLIWLALVCAKDDRVALVNAYSGDMSQDAVKQAMADIRAFESLQMKLFGTTKTELQRMMSTMSSKSLLKMSSDEIDDTEHRLHTDGANVCYVVEHVCTDDACEKCRLPKHRPAGKA